MSSLHVTRARTTVLVRYETRLAFKHAEASGAQRPIPICPSRAAEFCADDSGAIAPERAFDVGWCAPREWRGWGNLEPCERMLGWLHFSSP
jgi:hypothetical protein